MAIRLRLSVSARADLESIQDDGELQHGAAAAREHMAGFERIFALLRDHPMAGEQRPDYGRDIRTFAHRPHRLLYRVTEKEVLIVRVLHHAQDGRRALARDH